MLSQSETVELSPVAEVLLCGIWVVPFARKDRRTLLAADPEQGIGSCEAKPTPPKANTARSAARPNAKARGGRIRPSFRNCQSDIRVAPSAIQSCPTWRRAR